jgi:hypothetical protein
MVCIKLSPNAGKYSHIRHASGRTAMGYLMMHYILEQHPRLAVYYLWNTGFHQHCQALTGAWNEELCR